MTWTTPYTAVTGDALTAALWNTHVRDNLNMTGPAVATAAGGVIATDGLNSVIQRTPAGEVILTSQTTTSGTYTNLTTTGPDVDVVTGSVATVWWATVANNTTNGAASWCSVEVAGATTVAASDDWGLLVEHDTSSLDDMRVVGFHRFTALNPGTNTFRMKYKAGAGTAGFQKREIFVQPF